MNAIPIILCLLFILDVCVYISTPSHYRLNLPWWRYLPFASFYILFRYVEQSHPKDTSIEEVPMDEKEEVSESLRTLIIVTIAACLLLGIILDRLLLTFFYPQTL